MSAGVIEVDVFHVQRRRHDPGFDLLIAKVEDLLQNISSFFTTEFPRWQLCNFVVVSSHLSSSLLRVRLEEETRRYVTVTAAPMALF